LFRSLAATLAIAPRRRAIARASGLIGALLAGAAINVAVAWSCAVWSDATASPVGIMAPRRGEVHRADCAWWRRHAPGDLSAVTPDGVTHLRMGLGKQWSGMWREPRWDLGPPQVFHHGGGGWRVRAGWPMLALEHDRWQEDNRIDLQIHGAVLLVPDFMWGASDSCVPLRPVFPGAIVNTLFYAVGLALIRAGARRLQGYRGAPAGTDPPLFTVAAHRS
jgi:hypothetical protein